MNNDLKFKSRTPNRLLLKDNSEGILNTFKLEQPAVKTRNNIKPRALFENHTEKKLQTMKFDFYIKNALESEKVGNTNVGVYKKINSPLISESLKSKFSRVFKETMEKRPSVETNIYQYNLESKGIMT
jgi:hypothetical protein